MIGDVKARGKVHSTTKDMPVFKDKRAGRGGVKTIAPSTGKDDTEGGGDHEQAETAKRMVKGMKNGPGKENGPGPKPFMEKSGPGKNSGFKTMSDRGTSDGGGSESLSKAACVDAWCQGKRSTYK
jgi:hypothetical protein